MNKRVTLKLKDYASITMGQSPSSDNFSKDGTPFLQGNRTFGMKHPTYDTLTNEITRLARSGDVIFSVRAPVGDVNLLELDTCLGRGLCGLNSVDEDNEYLYYLMKYKSNTVRNVETGSVFGSVNKTDLEELEINLPSEEKRKQIAKILSTFDDAIKTNSQINDYLSTLKTEMFSNYLGSLKDCETVSLAEVATLQKETWKPSNVEEILEHYSIPAYDQNQFPIFDNSLYVKSNKTLVEKDCILVSKLNPETKRVWRPLCMTNLAVCSTEFLAIKAKNPDMKEYIHSFVESDLFTQHLTSIATGSTGSRQRALPSDAMSCVVPIPPLDVKYTVLMNALSDLSKSIKQNVMENDRLTNLRDYLLPKLMSGEINVSNLELSN